MDKKKLMMSALLLPAALNAQEAKKPNVILIITDQQTAGAMSCADNPYLRTPAMDGLAEDGIRFTNAYSPFPLSGPCRCSLLTGCYPSTIGVLGNGIGIKKQYSDNGIGHRMADAGYECLYAGKFHAPEQSVPENIGFTKICNFIHDPEIPGHVSKALDKYDGSKPLFLVVNFNNPHEICQDKHGEPMKMTGAIPEVDPCLYPPLPENFERTDADPDVLNLEVECGGQLAHYPVCRFSPQDWQRYLYRYYRLVERADDFIGQVIDAIKSHDLYDDSIIIFCSDHGDGAAAHEWNGKWALTEESVNVPMIIKTPKGKGPKGIVNNEALVTIGPDLYTTFCDCAGVSLDTRTYVGSSLLPVIYGKEEKTHDDIFIETKMNFAKLDGWSVRAGKYKYSLYQGGRNNEALFDIDADRLEMHNLIDDPAYADILKDCRYRMFKWAKMVQNWPCIVRIEPIIKSLYESPNEPVTILSSDLSFDKDPDDWFDAYMFMKSDWMRPQGIILTDYAGKQEFKLARELEEIAGCKSLPLLAGVNEPLVKGKTPKNTEGAEFILKTLREQRVKTRLIAIGSLRNEALAYMMDPELFKRKVEEVVFVSVATHGENVTNVNRDKLAVDIVFSSGVPILAVPNIKQKMTGEMEKELENSNAPVAKFLVRRLSDWRTRCRKDSPDFLTRTDQTEGKGKNLWSLPVFIPKYQWADYDIKAVRCNASYSKETSTVFPEDIRGNDFIMTQWNDEALLEYMFETVTIE